MSRWCAVLGFGLKVVVSPVAGAEELPIDGIAEVPPAGLVEAASGKRSALFFSQKQIGRSVVPFVGFFVGANGLALCPLEILCGKGVPSFQLTRDGRSVLKNPVMLGVFPEENLALLKFDYKPERFLKISGSETGVGTWVTAVPSGFADVEPVAGPIVAHRVVSNVSKLKPPHEAAKQFSVAAGRNPKFERVFLPGAPLVDERGEVVAVFAGSQALPGQTLRMACPVSVLAKKIEGMVLKGERRELPVAVSELPLDPAAFSDEYMMMNASMVGGDHVKAGEYAERLVAKYPDSGLAATGAFGVLQAGVMSGRGGGDELVAHAKKSKVREGAGTLEQAAYYERLGQALLATGKETEAFEALRRADELDPEVMACTTLAAIYEQRGKLEEAERCWRTATMVDAERIEYWDRLASVLLARDKGAEAEAVRRRADKLQDLYRMR